MFSRVRRHLTYANVMVTLLAVVTFGGGAIAIAAIPSASGAITGCMQKKSGSLRVVDAKKKCKRGERRLTWNQTGQPGQPGAPGKDGSQGAPGQNGQPGQDGRPGESAFKEFAYVSSLGHKLYGTADVTVSDAGTGAYSLTFDHTLANCAVQATPGRGVPSESGDAAASNATAEVELNSVNPKSAIVHTSSTSGAVDLGFFIAILC